jgi:hypothetical protein
MNQPLINKLTGVKRKHSDENQVETRKVAMEEHSSKRANFSALGNTNGLAKTSLVKPASGSVKKVVIKNLNLPKLPENYQVSEG